MDRVDAILTADWHLRESQPLCRTDDFWMTQWGKITYISNLQKKHDCPVLHAGDLFHFWKPSPNLISNAIRYLPKKFKTVYGNHDLPAHRLEELYRSGVYTLHTAEVLDAWEAGSWGWDMDKSCLPLEHEYTYGRKIFVWHKFVWMGEKPYPQAREEDRVENIMEIEKLKEFDVILTGDHHKSFSYTHTDGRLLVNAGQITRQVANAKPPCIWLYNADENEAEYHELSHVKEHVSRVHLDLAREKSDKLEAFIEGLSDDFDFGPTYLENLRRYMEVNRIPDKVQKIVWEAVEGHEPTV